MTIHGGSEGDGWSPDYLCSLADSVLEAIQNQQLEAALPQLTSLITASADSTTVNNLASSLVFKRIIEPLHDSFSNLDRQAYIMVFAHICQILRTHKATDKLDNLLREFQLVTLQDLVDRAIRLRAIRTIESAIVSKIKKVYIPTRVTIGADVAITGRIIAVVRSLLPQASLVLIGNQTKLQELFGGDPGIHYQHLEFERTGHLIDKLKVWRQLLKLNLFTGDDFIVLDPESRITQNGLLPLFKEEFARYAVFDPTAKGFSSSWSLGCRAELWAQNALGNEAELSTRPIVTLRTSDHIAIRPFLNCFASGRRRIAVLNFGVGGNVNKRIGREVELALVRELLAEDYSIIIDSGVKEEAIEAEVLLTRLREIGFSTSSLEERNDQLDIEIPVARVVKYRGGIGKLGALVSKADLYVGYDSMGQHVAAALGTPTITFFKGYTNELFKQAWTPWGPGTVIVIDVEVGATDARSLVALFSALLQARPWDSSSAD